MLGFFHLMAMNHEYMAWVVSARRMNVLCVNSFSLCFVCFIYCVRVFCTVVRVSIYLRVFCAALEYFPSSTPNPKWEVNCRVHRPFSLTCHCMQTTYIMTYHNISLQGGCLTYRCRPPFHDTYIHLVPISLILRFKEDPWGLLLSSPRHTNLVAA